MEEFDDVLLGFKEDLVKLKKSIVQSGVINVSKIDTLEKIGMLSRTWFKTLQPNLVAYSIEKPVLDKYSKNFSDLLVYSSKTSKSNSITSRLSEIIGSFHDELIIPVLTLQKCEEKSELEKIIENIKDPHENDYLREAISCAEKSFFRAAIILGWCATIDRIHRVIEKIGFDKFSTISEEMKKQTTGRFKRFNKSYQVNSMSEMQEVFDSDTILIIEALGLIDNNQNTRLMGCYNLRCNCGHPGNAPITKYNAMSFFSDIIEIVLNNPTFET